MFQHVLTFIAISFIVGYTNARVTCHNDRSCPDSYICDADGEMCCQNSSCPFRSSWSLSTTECLVRKDEECPIHMFCHEKGHQCTEKEISNCDLYLEAEKEVKCGSEGYPIALGFPTCSRMFYKHPQIEYEIHTTRLCTAHCLQHWLSDLLFIYIRECNWIERKMAIYEVKCLVECHFCRLPESWQFYFDIFQLGNRSETLVRSLAIKCAHEHQYGKGLVYQKTLLDKAWSLGQQIYEAPSVSNELGEMPQTTATTKNNATQNESIFENVTTQNESIFENVTMDYEPSSTSNNETSTTSLPDFPELHSNFSVHSNTTMNYLYLGLNWPTAVFFISSLIVGAVVGVLVSYFCFPRVVYNVECN